MTNVLLQRWTGNKDNGAELIGLGFKSQQQNQIKSNQTKPTKTNKQKKAMTKNPKQTQTREGSINSPNTPTITQK